MKAFVLSILSLILLMGCGTDKVSSPKSDGPAISLSYMNGLAKTSLGNTVATITGGEDTLFLDTLWMSRKFFFIVNNTSDEVLKNVKITSSNPAFIVSPSNIPVLNVSGESGLTPILELGVEHGTGLYSYVGCPLLWDGFSTGGPIASTTLTFSWDGGADTVVYNMSAYAKVGAIQILDENGPWVIRGNCSLIDTVSATVWNPGDTMTTAQFPNSSEVGPVQLLGGGCSGFIPNNQWFSIN